MAAKLWLSTHLPVFHGCLNGMAGIRARGVQESQETNHLPSSIGISLGHSQSTDTTKSQTLDVLFDFLLQ